MLLALFAGGCSSTDNLFSSQTSGVDAGSSAKPSLAHRISDLFLGTPKGEPATQTAENSSSDEIDCPPVDIRQGASTLMISGPDSGSPALSLRYQATFSRTARECTLRAGMVHLRVGVEGRIIVGPAGGPGQVTVPLRYALVKEGLEPKTLYSKLYVIPVTIGAGQPHVLFTHVEENMTVSMPPASEFDSYVIYVGFDPEGAKLERRKPATKSQAQMQQIR